MHPSVQGFHMDLLADKYSSQGVATLAEAVGNFLLLRKCKCYECAIDLHLFSSTACACRLSKMHLY